MARRDIGAPVVVGYLGVFWALVAFGGVLITSNTAPTAPGLKWNEEPAYTTTKLEIQIATEASDADGDKVDYTYVWKRNGEVMPDKNGKTVPAKEVRVGDVWEVVVTPNDGSLGGYGCALPWRECAGAVSASATVTIQNSPPTPRVKFVLADGTEVVEYDGKNDVQLQLSCLDADLVDAERDAAAAAKAAGEAQAAPTERVDPCTYTIAWWPADAAPAEGEVSPNTTPAIDKKTLASSAAGWKVVVIANDGQIDGPPTEVVLPRAEG